MLPAYTPPNPAPNVSALQSAPQSEHVVSLERNNGHKWLSLVIISRAASPKSLPLLISGDSVTGRVELDLDKEEGVKAVIVSVLAGTTAVGQEESRFLQLTQELWLSSRTSGAKPVTPKKLKGRHSWPFSISLPGNVSVIEPNGRQGSYALPPSFSERASPVYIDYRVKVVVKKGILRVDQPLTTSFGYLPVTGPPEPPSALRQMAYADSTFGLRGPADDAMGWKVCDAVLKLAIATPLCYALGTTIPVEVTLKSEDKQALDLLGTPDAVRLHLVRSMATGSDAMDDDIPRRSNNYFLESVGEAYFWQMPESEVTEGKRVLRGEIEVQKSLKPSFKFPRVAIRYMIHLLPFKTPGFVPETVEGEVLLSENVEMVTKQTPGIKPRSYAPPGYEKPQGGDYNRSMGFMENGNQRFYHHFS